MTTAPRPTFTAVDVAERAREMREILAGTVHKHLDDMDRDQATLEQDPDVTRWLWVPHERRTYLAALVPHGKRWAAEVARSCRDDHERAPTPYLVTPERVTAVTWELAVAMIEDLPDPGYTVVDRAGSTLLQTREWRQALSALEHESDALALTETVTGQVLKTKALVSA